MGAAGHAEPPTTPKRHKQEKDNENMHQPQPRSKLQATTPQQTRPRRRVEAPETPALINSGVTAKKLSRYALLSAQRQHAVDHKSLRLCGTRARHGVAHVYAVAGETGASYLGLARCRNPMCAGTCSLARQKAITNEVLHVTDKSPCPLFATFTIPKRRAVKASARKIADVFRRWFRSVERAGRKEIPGFTMGYIRALDLTLNPYESVNRETGEDYRVHVHYHCLLTPSHDWPELRAVAVAKWLKFARKLGARAVRQAQFIERITGPMSEERTAKYLAKHLPAELERRDTKKSAATGATGLGGLLVKAALGCEQAQALYREVTRELHGAKWTQRNGAWNDAAGDMADEITDEDVEAAEADAAPDVRLPIYADAYRVLVDVFGEAGELYPLGLVTRFRQDEQEHVVEFCEFAWIVAEPRPPDEYESMLFEFLARHQVYSRPRELLGTSNPKNS